MKTTAIRAATDFSEEADHAALRGAMLGAALGLSQGTLFHCLRPSRVERMRDFLARHRQPAEVIEEESRRALEERVERFGKQTGFRYEPRLVHESLVETLPDTPDRNDLLVLGGRGAGRVQDLMLGTTAEPVIRASDNPVLVVRNRPEGEWQRVMIPVDFSPDSRAALSLARELAPSAQLVILHALEPLPGAAEGYTGIRDAEVRAWRAETEQHAREQLDLLLADCGISEDEVEFIMEYAYPPALATTRAEHDEADLVVVGKQGHSRLYQWLIGSVTHHVLRRTGADVLVVSAGDNED